MSAQNYFFIEALSPLYEDVQTSEIFPDSKYFVDCIPKYPAGDILSKYESVKSGTNFDLLAFVQSNFELPTETSTGYTSGNRPIASHLSALWTILTRQPSPEAGTLIPLPFPYVVPGGRFREIYYWDSYFTMLGLEVSGQSELIKQMTDNFAWLIREIGYIPNGNRTYYMGRSQPPFFALMVSLAAEAHDPSFLQQYREPLEKEYAFWMDGADGITDAGGNYRRAVKLDAEIIANRYWDDHATPRPEAYTEDIHLAGKSNFPPAVTYRHIRAAAESGWDFSSRWFADGQNMKTIQTTDLIPIDLNCLLLYLEELLLQLYENSGEEKLVQLFHIKISRRKKMIQSFCWDDEKGFYFDYNFVTGERSTAYTLAAAYPLFFGVAEPRQAERVAAVLEEKFLNPGGLTTTLSASGQQWDAPNGWAPLQWMAYKGLKRYDFTELANEIKTRWTKNGEKVYAATGKMMEKYNVVDNSSLAGGGEYPNQDGFGWTNGVYLKMMAEKD